MKFTLAFLCCASFCGSCICALEKNTDGPISTNLKLVATIEGKSFFTDSSVARNWTEAGKYCESMGMKLGEITTNAQYQALKAIHEPDFNSGYWTSARDAHLPRQFSWNSTGDPLLSDFGEVKSYYDVPYQTCLMFWSKPNNTSSFYYRTCSGTVFVMCTT